MIFQANMIEAILDGHKTRTTRPATRDLPCRYRVGHDYAVQPGRGKPAVARIRVRAVRSYASVEDVPKRFLYARAEGFTSWHALASKWWSLYQHDEAHLLGPVWVIDFELVKGSPCG